MFRGTEREGGRTADFCQQRMSNQVQKPWPPERKFGNAPCQRHQQLSVF